VTLSRLRAVGFALVSAVLLAAAPVPPADGIATTFDLRQFAGAPLEVTSFVFAEDTRLACVTFHITSTQAVAAVTFDVLELDEKGAEHGRAMLQRSGQWKPGTIVRGDANDDRANCVAVASQQASAPVAAVRLTHAVYANGATWDAPTAPLAPIPDAVIATPSPPITGQPWSPAFHHDYVAVAYGAPDAHIALFEPGATVPSTTIDVGHCCVSALAFDLGGALYAETSSGVQIFTPGATTPTVRLPQHGFAMAVDPLGTVAAGGGRQGGPVMIYPHGGKAFALNVAAKFGGLAYAPDGTLAVANAANSSIEIYAPHATTPLHVFPVPNGPTLLAYDAAGRLLAANTITRDVTIYAAAAGIPLSTERGTEVRAVAFATGGRALLGGQGATRVLDVNHPGTPVVPVYGASADRLASGRDGTFVSADLERNLVVENRPDQQLVISGLRGLQALAISP
jgi:hypothetical protein